MNNCLLCGRRANIHALIALYGLSERAAGKQMSHVCKIHVRVRTLCTVCTLSGAAVTVRQIPRNSQIHMVDRIPVQYTYNLCYTISTQLYLNRERQNEIITKSSTYDVRIFLSPRPQLIFRHILPYRSSKVCVQCSSQSNEVILRTILYDYWPIVNSLHIEVSLRIYYIHTRNVSSLSR